LFDFCFLFVVVVFRHHSEWHVRRRLETFDVVP